MIEPWLAEMDTEMSSVSRGLLDRKPAGDGGQCAEWGPLSDIFFYQTLDGPDQTGQSLGLIFFIKIGELYELNSKVLFFQMLLVDFRETLDFLVSG